MRKRIFEMSVLIPLILSQSVLANHPPVPIIESPTNGATFLAKEIIKFKGKATDLEDGVLTGKSLIWKSDIDNKIGFGESFSRKLSPGLHLIILTAKDSKGASGTYSIFIEVEEDLGTEKDTKKPKISEKKPKIEKPKEKLKIKKEDIDMKRYFPLAVGNSWRYKRTVYKSDQIFHWTEATVRESNGFSNSFPKGTALFMVARSIGETVSGSEETYRITNCLRNEGKTYWEVRVKGDTPRDGRYTSIIGAKPPNIRWSYIGDYIWEMMDGNHFGAKTSNKSCLALLRPGAIVAASSKEKKAPLWTMGAKFTQDVITTPAGRFLNCLKNCTMVKGKNLRDVLLKDAAPEFSEETFSLSTNEGFGKFLTVSFYAKDVGLVKEVQYNFKGEITYKLELIDYNLK